MHVSATSTIRKPGSVPGWDDVRSQGLSRVDRDAEAGVFSIPSERSTSGQRRRSRYRRRYGRRKTTWDLVGWEWGVLNTDRLGVQMEEYPRQNGISALDMET